jgi:peptide/nickel transport system ATP-binding protein
MLKGENLSFRHGRHLPYLFKNLDIKLRANERLGLAGPSGVGKSTLGRVLAGYLKPETGRVLVDGEALSGLGRSPVQMLFQHPELAVNPRWKGKDILAEAGELQSGLLQRLAIDNRWLQRYPHELSGGELQRICLARALGPQTRYLICDEMTSMIDALTQAGIWKAVLAIAEQRGIGMAIISHDSTLLQKLCERVLACVKEDANTPFRLRKGFVGTPTLYQAHFPSAPRSVA